MTYSIENFKKGLFIIENNNVDKLIAIMGKIYPERTLPRGSATFYLGEEEHWKGCFTGSGLVISATKFFDIVFPKEGKKLIGYKLNGKITAQQAYSLLSCNYFLTPEICFQKNSNTYNKAKELGVLDLFFEPVYEEDKPSSYELGLACGKTIRIDKTGFHFEGHIMSYTSLLITFRPQYILDGYTLSSQSWKIGCITFTRNEAEKALELYNKL